MAAVDLRHILLDLLPSFDMKERCRELGIQHHLQKIIPDLWAINAVIRDATMGAWTQPDVEMWMADAGAAIADVHNLLDRILEWPGRVTASSNPLLRSFLGIRVAFRLSILQELKEMGLRLKELVLWGSALDLRKEMMDAMDPCDEEYSYVLGDEVVGRDEDRDNIIEILQQNQSSSNNGEPFVIVIHDEWSFRSFPISTGKRTLARMIYHHPWVRQHFHHRIWVDVSFDLSWDQLSIGREFARCITGDSCDHLQSHQAIWLLVNERLGQRRYLLILNDIYYDYIEEGLKDNWDQLKHNLLRVGGIGSTVIITTKYSTIFGSRDYSLAGLSKDAWIKLFMRETFIGSAQDKENTCTINLLLQFAEQQYETLTDKTIYDNIIKGFPLLAKTLGSIFRYTEVSRWQEVAYDLSCHSDVWRPYSNVKHHQHFKLMSLQNLSTKLARLRLYGSLCNLGWSDYSKEDYMLMMIAEDLMLQQSFDVEKMNRLINEIELRFSTLDSDYCMRTRIGQDSIRIPEQCCHLCLVVDSDSNSDATSTFLTALSAGVTKRLRTLILQTEEEMAENDQKCQIKEIPAAMFTNLVHLRILHLSHCRIQQLPNTIAKLVSLRYLNLSYTEIQSLPKYLSNLQNLKILKLAHCEKFQKLPEWIYKLKNLLILKLAYCQKLQMLPESIIALTNLQELDVEGCQSFMKLPEGLAIMKKLTMLNVDKCVSLTRLPHGIGQLTNLQKLSVHATVDSLASVILELQSLVNLKELRLKKLNGLSSVEDTRALKLQDKILLKCFTLCWEWWDMEVALVSDATLLHEQVLEDLQPNRALEKLEIASYMGKKLPSWMACKKENLWHLTEIKLVNLKKCERLPPLGQLPKLETVEISGMDSISAVDDAFYGDGNGNGDIFPRLESLIFSEMPMLERWLKAKGKGDMFPRLLTLILIQCPKFKELHVPLIRSGFSLSLWLNNDKLLSSEFVGWQNLKYVDVLEIMGCEELRCLPQGIKHLKSLYQLEIIRCNNLISLPDWLAELKSLEYVIVQDCAMLSFIPERLKQSPRFHIWIEG
ncbi:putative disease resistance protein RGA4 [Musa acuminata AAA Group]|uniref:putative disease resistance protein RGA4 n=1 Tax=Musa acuminata AAA Group TaxID=214697 RepID=UPI0031E27041